MVFGALFISPERNSKDPPQHITHFTFISLRNARLSETQYSCFPNPNPTNNISGLKSDNRFFIISLFLSEKGYGSKGGEYPSISSSGYIFFIRPTALILELYFPPKKNILSLSLEAQLQKSYIMSLPDIFSISLVLYLI